MAKSNFIELLLKTNELGLPEKSRICVNTDQIEAIVEVVQNEAKATALYLVNSSTAIELVTPYEQVVELLKMS